MHALKLAGSSWPDRENCSRSADGAARAFAGEGQLIDRIRDFFVENGLEPTADNLTLVHAAFSGNSPRLTRQFDAMREEGLRVTQSWLDALSAQSQDASLRRNVEHVFNHLAARLEVFSHTAARARSDSGSYQAALEQVAKVLPQGKGDDLFSSLAELTRAMAERAQLLEESMRRSEEDARILRQCLAQAERDGAIVI